MKYIATTFAHGNGPYSRCVEWAIEVNNVREERGLPRQKIVVPLVYPGRQERIMREEIETNVSPDFLEEHPDEILLDRKHGEFLLKLMFKGKNYIENLGLLVKAYQGVEEDIQRHLDGKRDVETLDGKVEEMDLWDAELQLGLNNRMQTGIKNQFYTAGGAGPFDEILERAITDERITMDRNVMKKVIPIAKRMIEKQKKIFSNEPGVFSYNSLRWARNNEISTPPFVHPPKPDYTELPGDGILVTATGIDGVRESGIYNAVADMGMEIFAPKFAVNSFPEEIRERVISLNPSQINNPHVIAQYARAGWSSIWLSHLAEKGFLTPPYQENDDPEMFFNEKGIEKLNLGVIIGKNARSVLENAIELAEGTKNYNQKLLDKYGTLDGIRYTAEAICDEMNY